MPYARWKAWGGVLALITAVVVGLLVGQVGLASGAGAASLIEGGTPSAGPSENPASSRALKGPTLPDARMCPGTVDVEGLIGFDLRVRNGSCSTARGAVRKARFRVDRVTIKGWRCRAADGYTDGGFYRCTRARVTIQFGLGV